MKLRVAGMAKESVVDGPGFRYAVFTQGCDRGCLGCHNPETHDPEGGEDIDVAELVDDITSRERLDGVTLSGGEPFTQIEACLELVNKIRSRRPDMNVICYTGNTLEELREKADPVINDFLERIDVLIDGPYVAEQRDLSLPFRGSRNQRMINLRDQSNVEATHEHD